MTIAHRQLPSPELPRIGVRAAYHQLLWSSFPFFMSQLLDVDGRRLEVAVHHERWCRLVEANARLLLLAPRSHGKTTVELAYALWRFYRHGADALSGRQLPNPGTLSIVLFSATAEQAAVLMARFRDLLAANADLFVASGSDPHRRRASAVRVRLANGAELLTRAFGTSTRGLHPDILILDDVLNDLNTGAQEQRDRAWRYFVGTLLPMQAGRIIVVGTAMHADDLLHRLAGARPTTVTNGRIEWAPGFGFHAVREVALNNDDRSTLWPERYEYAELAAFQAAEPIVFAREYQNDVRDDHASLFPRSLTQRALDVGAGLVLVPSYRKAANELVVLGADLAVSEAIGADYTVILAVAWNVETDTRRLLAARRERGLRFDEQVTLLRDVCRSHGVDWGIVENNGFQRWLADQLPKWPETDVIKGHTTGRGKANLLDGVPMLKMPLLHGRWTIPCGDPSSLDFARAWQSELAAFSWRDGQLRGLGEHDDIVMACWFVEIAIRDIRALLRLDDNQLVSMQDLGIERVKIGRDFD
jgi:hypothetical protein